MKRLPHQYIERQTGRVLSEEPYADAVIDFLYSSAKENAPYLFRILTAARVSSLLGCMNYDTALGARVLGNRRFLKSCRVDLSECVDRSETLKSVRHVFERKIRYWECRPMPDDPCTVVSPADSRMTLGSFNATSALFLKEKFFEFGELFGVRKPQWLEAFENGDFAVFRLTPEKYHYNHTPVAGRVLDIYEISGCYHSCNPAAVVAVVTPYSKNKRVVTIMDTDVPGGSRAGLVAMIEVVALMIGDVVQCYSEQRYESPRPITPGMCIARGLPKSLYRPGSSTDVLIFQKGRVSFMEDLVLNMHAPGVQSRFSFGFGKPLVETEVAVRSPIATAGDRR